MDPQAATPYCGTPIVPIRKLDFSSDPHRESLIRYTEKKWVNHTVLHYYFFHNSEWRGTQRQMDAVRSAFATWKGLGIGLTFTEVSTPGEAELRIGFEPGGSWSYVGRDSVDFASKPTERTINFGWDLTTPYGRDTALHEIGHAIGFPHEHQNPNAGIVWDEQAAYSYFGGPPNNWDRAMVDHNIIRKISSQAVQGSQWDKNSIMHYGFPPGIITTPSEYQTRPLTPTAGLSDPDIAEAKKFYPGEETHQGVTLVPYYSQIIDIDPGQQLDFVIQPREDGNYTMQSFGPLDVVMVLFEVDQFTQNDPKYLAGDDDSGYHFNSLIRQPLLQGHVYMLRVRLYYAESKGQGAVLLWK